MSRRRHSPDRVDEVVHAVALVLFALILYLALHGSPAPAGEPDGDEPSDAVSVCLRTVEAHL